MKRNPPLFLRFLIILNLLFLVQSNLSLAAASEKRVALVIGNSAYQNTPPLANPRNDASAIGQVLKRIGFDVDMVFDAGKSDMDQALRRFGNKLDGSRAAVFYYAGHGIQVDGINYILPVDANLKKERDLNWEVSDMTVVLKQMEGHNRVNLLFLDACRDNPLSQTLARSMGENRSASIGRGLAPMKASAGTLISYSTKDGEVATDGIGKHSPYTEALLKYIEMPGIEVGLMLRKVREEVIAATNKRQVPWEYGSLLGEFYFTGPVTVQILPKADNSAVESKTETLYWESIMNYQNPAVFEAYLKKYPHGEFSELARIKLADLKKESVKSGKTSVADSLPNVPVKTSGSQEFPSESPDASVLPDGKPTGNTNVDGKPSGVNAKVDDKPAGKSPVEISDSSTSLKRSSKYSKLGINGIELPDTSPSWMMVRDNETGLVWEVKQNKDGVKDYGNPNDSDNTYLFFEASQKFIAALNTAKWGGFSDWRLPNRKELGTLYRNNDIDPRIDTSFFPNTQSLFYWSSTTDFRDRPKAVGFSGGSGGWGGDFDDYYGGNYGKSGSYGYYVRAVRGGQ